MVRTRLALAALTGALLLGGIQAASAQALCGDRTNFLKHLGKSYKEAPTAMGLTSNGKVIEVLTSEKGSWTIIVTNPEGTSCVVAAGEAWESIERLAMKPAA